METKRRHFTEEHRRKLSESHKGKPSNRKGKHHSLRTRLELSAYAREQFSSKEVRDGCRARSIRQFSNEDARKKIGVASRAMWAREGFKERMSKKLKEAWARPEHRTKMLDLFSTRKLPFRDTACEIKVFEYLESRGITFEKFSKPKEIPGRHKFDIVIPSKKVVVEVDGCYWHVCLEHFPLKQDDWRKAQVQRDLKVEKSLEGSGWGLVRIWEHEVFSGDWSKLLSFF